MGPSTSGSSSNTSSTKSTMTSVTDFLNNMSNWFSNFSSGQSSSPWAGTLVGLGEQTFGPGSALNDTLIKQLREALTTGGVGAQVPFIQNAVTSSLTGTNAAMSQARNAMGQVSVGNDPLSQGILGGLNVQGQQTAANIGPTLTENFISMAPGIASNTISSGLGAIGVGAGLDRTYSGNQGGTGGQTSSGQSNTRGTQNSFTTGTGNFNQNQSFDWGSLFSSLLQGAGNSIQYNV